MNDIFSRPWLIVYFFNGHVLIPNNVYNPQNHTRLVAINTIATTSAAIARFPGIIFVKYNASNPSATTILTALSVVQIFLCMSMFVKYKTFMLS